MFKTKLICALLTLTLKSINGQACPYRAPITVTNVTMGKLDVTFQFTVDGFYWLFLKTHEINLISGVQVEQKRLKKPKVSIDRFPKSFYVKVAKDPTMRCDLKLAIDFTNNSSSTTGNSISMDHFRSTPCVSIESLKCRNEPTLSITYWGIVHLSAASDNTIKYSGATLVYCNGPSDNHFKWYYDNDTTINNGREVTITESMAGASVYCVEIAPCYYKYEVYTNSELCTLARSKIYTLHFVKTGEPSEPTLSVISHNGIVHESATSGNSITYRGATFVYCVGQSDDHLKWYYENDTEIIEGAIVTITKSMSGASVYCAEIEPCGYSTSGLPENCTLALSRNYTLNFEKPDELNLSISYNGIVYESDSSDNTITYREPTLVYCSDPSDNHFKWYYDNDRVIIDDRAVNITESMDGASVYCAEIGPCNFSEIPDFCTIGRSKIYTLNYEKTDFSKARLSVTVSNSSWIIYLAVALPVLAVSLLVIWRVITVRRGRAHSESCAAVEPSAESAPIVQEERHSNVYEEVYDDVYEARRNRQRLIEKHLKEMHIKRPPPPPVETMPGEARRALAASPVGTTEHPPQPN